MIYRILFLLFGMIAYSASAQQVLHLLDGQHPAPASIEQVAWMEGSWTCDIWGGRAEEIWLSPVRHSMEGFFRFTENDSVSFLEIITVRAENNSLTMELKHFDGKLHGWEAADEVLRFPLVYWEPNRAYFDGITYILRSPNQMDVYVDVSHTDGSQDEQVFSYKRNVH